MKFPALLILLTSLGTCFGGKLVFENLTVEMTAKPDQEVVTCDFAFTVEGEDPAVIDRLSAACSCLEAQVSDDGRLTWQPGEAGTVRGVFKVGNFRGLHDKQITLMMMDGTSQTLTVSLTVPVLVDISPKTLVWKSDETTETKSFEIEIKGDNPIEITGVEGTNDAKFPYQFETIEKGKSYRLTVTPQAGAKAGMGLIRFKTNSKYQKHRSYQAFAVIKN